MNNQSFRFFTSREEIHFIARAAEISVSAYLVLGLHYATYGTLQSYLRTVSVILLCIVVMRFFRNLIGISGQIL